MNPWLCAALTGLTAGAHSSIWGMYKDAPHEGFSLRVFTRSMVFGTAVALRVGGECLPQVTSDVRQS